MDAEQKVDRMEELSGVLDKLRDRLEMAVSAAGIGIWEWDIAEGDLWWDTQMHRIFGTSKDTWAGNYDSFANCLHDDDRVAIGDLIRRSMVDRLPYRYEFRLKTVPGRVVFGGGRFYFSADGLPVRAIGVCLVKEG